MRNQLTFKKMSRIGKKPITVPENIEVTIEGATLRTKGPKGELSMPFEEKYVSFKLEDGTLTVSRKDDSKSARARHGLYRSLAANLIEGVLNGFSKKLEIRGVGYRAVLQGSAINFNLGYSHPISFQIPEGVQIEFDKENQNIFTISGNNKQLVGQVAANIRSFRKPEPYKGKGIRYVDEQVARKAGKSGAKEA